MQFLFDIIILQHSSDKEILLIKRKLFKIRFILSGKFSIIYDIKLTKSFFIKISIASGSITKFLRSPEISTSIGILSLSFN
jgi:hypothetical protein